ncbi:MAG: CubicO group peptidase (beta-lactamase class C family) [Flavobacteriales bacterium]|jgi:CubicO group peptidase (beta-lactamase class C family)
MNTFKIYILSALLLPLGLLAQVNFDSLDTYFKNGMEVFDQVGMTVGIVKDGEMVFSKAYGFADKQAGVAMTTDAIFAVASVSKAFTAASIGLLVDEGKIKWDDKVVEHLPAFKLYDPYVTANMEVRDLLCHRNGYNTFDGDLLWYGTAKNYDRHEVLRRFQYLAPKHGFRTEYGYQNTMFLAAALLIENVSGMTWEEFIQTRIFDKLGMNNSISDVKKIESAKAKAYPHIKGNKVDYQDYSNAIGAVGVHTNINDMQHWVNMWLNYGKHGEVEFLKPATVHTILAAHTPEAVRKSAEASGTHFEAAALGWFVKDMFGVKIANHSGGLPGFILNVVLVPEKQLGILCFTNDETILPFAVTNRILESYLTDTPKDWVKSYGAYHNGADARNQKVIDDRLAEKNKKKKPGFDLADAVGVFEDVMYGEAEITLKGKQLHFVMKPTADWFFADMEHWVGNTFRVQLNDPFLPNGFVTIQLDSHGKIDGFKIDLPNPDFHFYNLDFKKK